MSSGSDNETRGRKSSYIKLTGRKKFAEWKRKTEALAAQQGYMRFLKSEVEVPTEEELETEWAKVEAESDPDAQKKLKTKYLKKKSTRKLSTSASCMLMMSVPGNMSKKLEPCMESPYTMFKIVCAKYDKKGNNKLSNLCKELEKCKLRNTKTEPDDWFTNLTNLNDRIEKISPDFKKTEKQLAMHIMNNMCDEYKDLKLLIENKANYLDDIEDLQTTIQDHWETYYVDKSDSESESESDDDSEEEKKNDHALTMTEEKKKSNYKTYQSDRRKPDNGLVCDHCGKPGHTKDRCFKLHGYPKEWEDRRTCYICGKTGHIAKDCPNKNQASLNKKDSKEEKEEEINGLFIGMITCTDCNEKDKDKKQERNDKTKAKNEDDNNDENEDKGKRMKVKSDDDDDKDKDKTKDEKNDNDDDEVIFEKVVVNVDEIVSEEDEVTVTKVIKNKKTDKKQASAKRNEATEQTESATTKKDSNEKAYEKPRKMTEEEAIQWMGKAYGVRTVQCDIEQTMRRVEIEETLRSDRETMMVNRELWGQTGTGEYENPNFNLPDMYREQAEAEVKEEEQKKRSSKKKGKKKRDNHQINMITVNHDISGWDQDDDDEYISQDESCNNASWSDLGSNIDNDSSEDNESCIDMPDLVQKQEDSDSSDDEPEDTEDDDSEAGSINEQQINMHYENCESDEDSQEMPQLCTPCDDDSSDEEEEDEMNNTATNANIVKKLTMKDEEEWVGNMQHETEQMKMGHRKIEKWLGDTGASCHVTGNGSAMKNTTTKGTQTVVVGDGRKNTIKKSGALNLVLEDSKGQVQLKDAKLVPDITKNIVSISALLQQGGTMTGNKDAIKIKYKGTNLMFTRCEKDGLYYLRASRLHSSDPDELELMIYDVGVDLDKPIKQEDESDNYKDNQADNKGTKENKPKNTTKTVMNRKEAHEKWGHQYKDGCDLMAKYMGIKLQGKLSCTGCGLVKAREKGVNKKSSRVATRKGERICIDTTGPYPKNGKGTRYWMCALDDYSDMCWLHFAKSKNEMTKFVAMLIEQFKGKGIKIEYIRCDNAGEHMQKLKDLCRVEGIELEYTAPGSPRQNGRVEKKINLIWQRALTSMVHARLTKEMQAKLWAEAVNCSAFQENIILKSHRSKPALEAWTGKSVRPWFNKMVQFGRIGYIAKKNKIKSKMKEKGYIGIMVGYAANSGSGTYRLYKPDTKRVVQSRDVKWDNFVGANANNDQSIYDFEAGIEEKAPSRENRLIERAIPPPVPTKEFETSDDDDSIEQAPPHKSIQTTKKKTTRRQTLRQLRSMAKDSNGMTLRGGKKIGRKIVTGDVTPYRVGIVNHVQDEGESKEDTKFNPVHDKDIYFNDETIDRGLMHLPSIFLIEDKTNQHDLKIDTLNELNSLELSSDFNTPTTINHALSGPEKELWKKSATAEVNNFLKRGSWIIRDKKKIKENGRKLIGVKWVFKKKDEPDGSIRFKSRIVTKGYMQIPGVDYTESFSPVATATSFRVGLALTLFYDDKDWICELVDVEAAFLEGKLKAPVYIDLPKGMVELGFMSKEEFDQACAELTGGMYGCVDAALLYFERFCEWAVNPEGLNLTQSKADPCVFYRKSKTGTPLVIVICHVDDCCVMGVKEYVEEIKKKLKLEFGTVEDGQLRKLLGVRYEWKRDEEDQPYIVMTMRDKAEDIVKSYEKYTGKTPKNQASPGAPGQTLSKNKGEAIMMKEYRSLVGQAMFYSTKIAPECAFANGQLARHMQNPGEEHWKAMERFVGYIKTKTEHQLIMKRPSELRTITYCDSSYGDCKDTRRSSMGEVHTIGGSITSWRSQRQKIVTQSSTEAEYITLSEAAKEQKFTQMLLEEIAEVETPGYIYGDNEASIFLAKNKQVSNRTKHIDIRQHYIRECVDEGRIELKRVDTKENKSDIMTKNLPVKTFEKDGKNLLDGNIMHEVHSLGLNNDRRTRENVSSHNSFCEKHLSFAHYKGKCHTSEAYACKPRLNNKIRKREDIYYNNRKSNKYRSQRKERNRLNGRKKRIGCNEEGRNGKNIRINHEVIFNIYRSNKKVNGSREGMEINEKSEV